MVKIRAMVVFKGRTNIPEDQFVNTLHFDSGSQDYETAVETLCGDGEGSAGLITNVWNTVGTIGLEQLSKYRSRFISSEAEIRCYDMSDPKPRVPRIVPWTVNPGLDDTNDLPEEVACCVSFHGSAPFTARRRGRVYIGPLNTFAVGNDTGLDGGVAPSRPKFQLQQAAAGAFDVLMRDTYLAGLQWQICSMTPSINYVNIVGGHVDNAWDTQRRRGVDPTSRVRFPPVA